MSENTNETNVKDPLEGTYFHDADIIPMVQYQVYGLDKVWFWDNEGQNYTRTNASTIKIQTVTGTTPSYKKVALEWDTNWTKPEDFTGGTEVESLDNVPNDAKVGDVYYHDDNYKKVKGTWTTSEATTGGTKLDGTSWDGIAVPDGAEKDAEYYIEVPTYNTDDNATPYEFNKYEKVTPGKEILVTLDLDSELKANYPGALITINGKEYTLGYAENPFKLVMDRDYRISINWVWGEVVETFRIICNR